MLQHELDAYISYMIGKGFGNNFVSDIIPFEKSLASWTGKTFRLRLHRESDVTLSLSAENCETGKTKTVHRRDLFNQLILETLQKDDDS